jgi:hypothetical protein
MPSPSSVHKRGTTNEKNTQHNKLPATVKELQQLQKAVAESLKQMGEEKNSEQSGSTDDSEQSGMEEDSEHSDMEEDSEKSGTESRNKQQAHYQNVEENWSGNNADRIDSDAEAKQSEKNESEEEDDSNDDDFEEEDDSNDDEFELDEHSSVERESNSHDPNKNINFLDEDTSDEEDSHKEQHGREQKARWTDDSEDSEQHSNTVTQHKQTGNSSVEELEGAEESFAEEQAIHGKITPPWYGDANKGLLRRRMGIKADLPLQQQNAIVRTLRKLVRTKCGSDLDKPWSTYGRTVQNRMINSMYNTSFML